MSKNIVIIGSALSGNKGAAAMLESAIQTLSAKVPGARFTLLTVYPGSDKKLNHYKNLKIVNAKPLVLGLLINPAALIYRLLPFSRKYLSKKLPAIEALSKADILLDQGGITFVDGREVFLIYNVATVLPALFMGVPIFKCAQALGPFKNPINRITSKMFLPKMAHIVARGSITYSYLEGLDLQNISAGADYAFSLEVQASEKKLAESYYDKSFFSDSKVVGISPSVVLQKKAEADGKDYRGIVVEFIDYLTVSGYKVVLMPHSVRNTTKTHNNDMPLCRDIFNGLKNKEKVLFLDKELDSQVLRYIIGKCDFFVASRFHAMVSSLAMKVPTIVIGWSHKYKEVLEMFGLEKWAFGQDKLTIRHLQKTFEELVKDNNSVKQSLSINLPRVKKLSKSQADTISKMV